jgi:hypothetical protein
MAQYINFTSRESHSTLSPRKECATRWIKTVLISRALYGAIQPLVSGIHRDQYVHTHETQHLFIRT